jgi:hypothetical protein
VKTARGIEIASALNKSMSRDLGVEIQVLLERLTRSR